MMPDETNFLGLQTLVKFCKIFTYDLCQNAFGEISLQIYTKFREIIVTKFYFRIYPNLEFLRPQL
jgi:hypothetical protein